MATSRIWYNMNLAINKSTYFIKQNLALLLINFCFLRIIYYFQFNRKFSYPLDHFLWSEKVEKINKKIIHLAI